MEPGTAVKLVFVLIVCLVLVGVPLLLNRKARSIVTSFDFVRDNVPPELFPFDHKACMQSSKKNPAPECANVMQSFNSIRPYKPDRDLVMEAFGPNRKALNIAIAKAWAETKFPLQFFEISEVLPHISLEDETEFVGMLIAAQPESHRDAERFGFVSFALGEPSASLFADKSRLVLLLDSALMVACGKTINYQDEEILPFLVSLLGTPAETDNEGNTIPAGHADAEGAVEFVRGMCFDKKNMKFAQEIPRREDCICGEDLRQAVANGVPVVCAPCGDQKHLMCQQCFEKLTEQNPNRCPQCRGADFNVDLRSKLF